MRNIITKSIIPGILVRMRKFFSFFGINLRKRTPDRTILEQVIFPYFIGKDEFKKILFVGCEWFTKRYNAYFKGKDEYWTIEIDPKLSKYGSENHITDSVENIDKYFKKNELDLIICNGVFGWGLNEKEAVEKAFNGCFDILRKGGIFIIGWNDNEDHRPFPLDELKSLKRFKKHFFEPLSEADYLTSNPNRHTFSFYEKV